MDREYGESEPGCPVFFTCRRFVERLHSLRVRATLIRRQDAAATGRLHGCWRLEMRSVIPLMARCLDQPQSHGWPRKSLSRRRSCRRTGLDGVLGERLHSRKGEELLWIFPLAKRYSPTASPRPRTLVAAASCRRMDGEYGVSEPGCPLFFTCRRFVERLHSLRVRATLIRRQDAAATAVRSRPANSG